MAMTVEECQEITDLSRETGKKYMMMKTVVYSREFLFVKELYKNGELGKIQFLQGTFMIWMNNSTCPSPREPDTAGRIRIWPMNL